MAKTSYQAENPFDDEPLNPFEENDEEVGVINIEHLFVLNFIFLYLIAYSLQILFCSLICLSLLSNQHSASQLDLQSLQFLQKQTFTSKRL
jgi:hypothetical protein